MTWLLDREIKTRRRFEISVLRRYHKKLLEKGAEEDSWKQLFDDYRLCAATGIYIAAEYCRGIISERRIPVWLPMLRRS